jgi:hypothetical protein
MKKVLVVVHGFSDPVEHHVEEPRLVVRDNKALEIRDNQQTPVSVYADGVWAHAHITEEPA